MYLFAVLFLLIILNKPTASSFTGQSYFSSETISATLFLSLRASLPDTLLSNEFRELQSSQLLLFSPSVLFCCSLLMIEKSEPNQSKEAEQTL